MIEGYEHTLLRTMVIVIIALTIMVGAISTYNRKLIHNNTLLIKANLAETKRLHNEIEAALQAMGKKYDRRQQP